MTNVSNWHFRWRQYATYTCHTYTMLDNNYYFVYLLEVFIWFRSMFVIHTVLWLPYYFEWPIKTCRTISINLETSKVRSSSRIWLILFIRVLSRQANENYMLFDDEYQFNFDVGDILPVYFMYMLYHVFVCYCFWLFAFVCAF